MEIRVLKYFYVVAKEENITRAAALLHISQPALSRQLMQLEEELGVTLFRRSRHRIVLTEEGKLLARRAQEMMALMEKTEKELRGVEENVSGELAIGCGETKNLAFLAQKMKSFRQKYPEVNFQIQTANANVVKEQMERGILDFGLLLEPVEITKYNFIQMPYEEKWCVLMRKDSPLAQKSCITPVDLEEIPLMLPKRSSVRNELENWFGTSYEKLDIAVFCNVSYSNRSILVENGVGVAMVHEFDCPSDNLCLRPICPEVRNRSVLVWKKDQITPSAMLRFIEWLKM